MSTKKPIYFKPDVWLLSRNGTRTAPQTSVPLVNSLAHQDLEFRHLAIIEECEQILKATGAPSTVKNYHLKWKHFVVWTKKNSIVLRCCLISSYPNCYVRPTLGFPTHQLKFVGMEKSSIW